MRERGNPNYLHFLATQKLYDDPAFVEYLQYLLYFTRVEYSKFLLYVQLMLFQGVGVV